ncbi:hypothetical protein ABT095_27375 [Kitasatospora sp. NPDC002227]|uniref:hypothetical protein n=1 Tax=Kitasatospora sp. NPDC002227 TaxID=3154773 RepID=UPI0033187043
MAEQLPANAVVRISPATFDPGRFAEADAANLRTAVYLEPAIKQLPGLLHYYVGVSPEGSMVHVSVWDTDEHASQLSHLKEMTVVARAEMEAAGVTFGRIINHPVSWTL